MPDFAQDHKLFGLAMYVSHMVYMCKRRGPPELLVSCDFVVAAGAHITAGGIAEAHVSRHRLLPIKDVHSAPVMQLLLDDNRGDMDCGKEIHRQLSSSCHQQENCHPGWGQ